MVESESIITTESVNIDDRFDQEEANKMQTTSIPEKEHNYPESMMTTEKNDDLLPDIGNSVLNSGSENENIVPTTSKNIFEDRTTTQSSNLDNDLIPHNEEDSNYQSQIHEVDTTLSSINKNDSDVSDNDEPVRTSASAISTTPSSSMASEVTETSSADRATFSSTISQSTYSTIPQTGMYAPPQYSAYPEDEYTDEDESEVFGPGTCRYGGKLYVSAQQIPRDDPCDFCFCFRSDIICLQQSCPPPISGCREEPIHGFCCPRYECPVSMGIVMNITTSTTTTSTTLPPHFLSHNYQGSATRSGCFINGVTHKIGDEITSSSGPCMQCL